MAIKALINRFNLRSKSNHPDTADPASQQQQQASGRANLVPPRRPIANAHAPPPTTALDPSTHFNPFAPPDLSTAPSPSPARAELPTPTEGGSSSSNSPTQRRAPAPAEQPGASKKVAFLSPPPTPGGLFPTRTLPESTNSDDGPPVSGSRRRGNSFTEGRTSQDGPAPAAQPGGGNARTGGVLLKQRTYSNPNQPEGRTSFASVSRLTGTRSRQSQGPLSPQPSSPQAVGDGAFSLRSGTPYSHMSGRSFVQAASSWSEAAEEDLVSNLGPRERTRQEVLWEIVTSEERYVSELIKMKETFIDPLLHPFTAPVPISQPPPSLSPPHTLSPLPFPSSSLNHPNQTLYESDAEDLHPQPSRSSHHPQQHHQQVDESLEYLPIAARFLSSPSPKLLESDLEAAPSSEEGEYALPAGDGDWRRSTVTSTGGRSPYGSAGAGQRGRTGKASGGTAAAVPFPSRSHQSLPPQPRLAPSASTTSLGRTAKDPAPASTPAQTASPRPGTSTPSSRPFRKLQKPRLSSEADVPKGISPQALPEDLRECLSVLERGILGGHVALSEGLRRRYEEQYPLVRSLADVFVSHSHILREYATYVLHLERALEQVDAFLATDVKKKPKKQEVVEWMRISRILQHLEDVAADKGETGLAISLSKPFQRLLKYPLLFQNLLFHTDPSTFEYEATLLMVAEVETIVRSIEDEKILKEERDRTRDVMARIEGLEKDRLLGAPKSSRVLVEERLLDEKKAAAEKKAKEEGQPAPSAAEEKPSADQKQVKQKSSFRRLSEQLPGGSSSTPPFGSKKDLWLVVFNDVILRCQRTGVTTLPLVSSSTQGGGGGTRSASAPELAGTGKGKFASVGNQKRASHVRPRNLYKFLRVETWEVDATPREGIVSMEDIGRSRAQLTEEAVAALPTATDGPGGEGDDDAASDESDRKSKMSFSYWGADRITVQRKLASSTPATPTSIRGRGGSTTPRRVTPGLAARESSANAKFGSRLRSPEGHHPPSANRPVSRQHAAGPGGPPGVVRRGTNTSDDGGRSLQARPPWGSNLQAVARRDLATGTAKRATPAGAAPPAIPGAKAEPAAATAGGASTEPPAVRSTKYSSTAPSEDSGVGLYKAVIAANPSINKLNMT